MQKLLSHLIQPRNTRLIKLDDSWLMWCLVGKKKWIRFGWLIVRFEDQRI